MGKLDLVSGTWAIKKANTYTNSVVLNGVPVRYPEMNPATKTWQIFDPAQNAYVETGIVAEGVSPHVGDNGNWFVGTVDTGVKANGIDSTKDVSIGDSITVSVPGTGFKVGDVILPTDDLFGVLKKLLNPVQPPQYNQPSLSLSGLAPRDVEIGTNISPTLTPSWTQNDAGDLTTYRLYKNGEQIYTGGSAVPRTDSAFQLTAPVSYYVAADYQQGAVKNDSEGNPDPTGRIQAGTRTSGNVVYNPYRMAFYGHLAAESEPTDSNFIRALANSSLNPGNGTQLTVSVPVGANGMCFAYPASIRAPQNIIQQSISTDVLAGMRYTTIAVTGANGYDQIEYRVYYRLVEFSFTAIETFVLTI